MRAGGVFTALRSTTTLRVATLTALGMLLGLAVDAVIAARLGAGAVTDALILGLTVPLFLETVLREGSKFSLVPLIMERAGDGDGREGDVSGLVNLAAVTGVLIVLVAGLLAPGLAALISPGLGADQRGLVVEVLRLALPMVLLSAVANVLAAFLNSRGWFALPATRYLVVGLVVVAGALAAPGAEELAVTIAVLYSVGYLAYALLLAWAARARGLTYSWRGWLPRRELGRVLAHLGWPFGGFLSGQLMRIAERALASTVEPGGVALYYFAFRIFNAVRNLVGMSVATVNLPELTRRQDAGDPKGFAAILRRSSLRVLLLVLPLVAAVAVFSDEIVALVLGRGQFGAAGVADAAGLLRVLALGLVLFGLTPVLMGALYARRRQLGVFLVMLATAGVNLVLALLLLPALGLAGLAWAFVASSLVSVAGCLLVPALPWRKTQ